jgi:aquaporin Z
VAGPTAWRALRKHWFLYAFEGLELSIFMLSACAFTVFLFDPSSATIGLIPSAIERRALMGIAMGLTAVLIIHSPMGKRSGAHFNPAITLSYLRLGKIALPDAVGYAVGQFLGGVFGVWVAKLCFGNRLSDPNVDYAVTVPGRYGTAAAFFAELFMSVVLMAAVLWMSNRPQLAKHTSSVVGCLIAFYILVFAPVSGFSINPARTVGSAVFAHVWTSEWIYFVAPMGGMLGVAELYFRFAGANSILCAKLHPDARYPCPFLCHFPGHLQDRGAVANS